jgi:hypothetical protein
MNKLLVLFCLLSLVFITTAMGQGTTMTIGSLGAPVAGPITVPINVTNVSNVGAINLKMSYDPSVATFTGVTSAVSGVTFSASAVNGIISIGWYDASGTTPMNVITGKLLDISLTYIGGNGAIAFNTSQCEIADGAGAVISGVTYQSGNIGTAAAATLTIGSVVSPVAGAIAVPININATTSPVGAISLRIAYDPSVATFTGVTSAVSGVTFTASASNGVISIGWYDATGTTPISVNAKLLDINLTYVSGNCPVTFKTAQCELSNSSGGVITGVAYQGGSIGAAATTTMSIGSVASPVAGAITLPLNVTNFNNVGSIGLKIKYDPTVATFTSVTSAVTGVTFTASAASGVISISWYDASGTTPASVGSGKLLDLNLTYVSGCGAVAFDAAQCEIANAATTVLSVAYSNATIGAVPTLALGNVTAPAVSSPVNVPINVTNFNNIGSITLKVAYDPAMVTYTGVTSAVTGVTFTAGASNGVVSIAWFDATGTTPIGIGTAKLLDINFTYSGGTGAFTFNTAQCELSNSANVVITGVTYQNGSLTTTPAALLVKAKVLLQGPNSGGVMTTALNSGGLIPLNSATAYNATTFGYTAETVTSIPNANVVDWVLVELRTGTASSTKVETQPAFLLKDGSIVDVNGSSDVSFSASANSYYIVIRHRNHLAVISSTAVSLPNGTVCDLGTMTCGDTDGSGVVDVTDRANTWNARNTSGVYTGNDTDLSGVVDVTDRANTWNNRNLQTLVP